MKILKVVYIIKHELKIGSEIGKRKIDFLKIKTLYMNSQVTLARTYN